MWLKFAEEVQGMRRFLVVVALAAACSGAWAQQSGWPVGPGHTVLTLWPNGAPRPKTATGPEGDTSTATSPQVAGRPVVRVGNVSVPTLTLSDEESADFTTKSCPVSFTPTQTSFFFAAS